MYHPAFLLRSLEAARVALAAPLLLTMGTAWTGR